MWCNRRPLPYQRAAHPQTPDSERLLTFPVTASAPVMCIVPAGLTPSWGRKPTRAVLLLAYVFPPLGGGGVQRSAKFVKYLPRHGWMPTVITTSAVWYGVRDQSLVNDIPPEVRVLSSPENDILRRSASLLSRRQWIPSRLRDLPAQVLTWPDPMSGWIPGALAVTLRELRTGRYDVLMTTSAPYSAHVVGALARRITGVPWVADFRDEWSQNPELDQPELLKRWSGRVERSIVSTCDHVIVTTDRARITGAEGKQTTITNGIDPTDIERAVDGAVPVSSPSTLTLSFIGSLYGDRNCREVLVALRRLSEQGTIDPDRVEFRVVGNVWVDQLAQIAGQIRVTQVGYVSHRVALAEMKSADALVAYLPSQSRSIPGKIFEYLASGRPILCVVGRGSASFDIVRNLGVGYSVEPSDSAGLDRALTELWGKWLSGKLREDAGANLDDVMRRYSREKLAGDLARVLDEVATARPRGLRPATGS
jgi:glycosyltransferase involved in cell wall biosynthesis